MFIESLDDVTVNVTRKVVMAFDESLEAQRWIRAIDAMPVPGAWLLMSPLTANNKYFTVEYLLQGHGLHIDRKYKPTSFRFRLDPDRFVLQGADVDPQYQRMGLATDVAIRMHAMIAPRLPAYVQGSFTDEGLAWAEHMRDHHGWALM